MSYDSETYFFWRGTHYLLDSVRHKMDSDLLREVEDSLGPCDADDVIYRYMERTGRGDDLIDEILRDVSPEDFCEYEEDC